MEIGRYILILLKQPFKAIVYTAKTAQMGRKGQFWVLAIFVICNVLSFMYNIIFVEKMHLKVKYRCLKKRLCLFFNHQSDSVRACLSISVFALKPLEASIHFWKCTHIVFEMFWRCFRVDFRKKSCFDDVIMTVTCKMY